MAMSQFTSSDRLQQINRIREAAINNDLFVFNQKNRGTHDAGTPTFIFDKIGQVQRNCQSAMS